MLFSLVFAFSLLLLLISTILYLRLAAKRPLIVIKRDNFCVMNGRKRVRVGVILPFDFFNKSLEDLLKVNGLEISLELVMTRGKRHKFVYLYHSSPELLSPLSRAQSLQGSALNDTLLSILGGKKTVRTVSVEKNIVCIRDSDSPLYVSLITFTLLSHQTIRDLVERLESLSKNFDVDVRLVFPLKLKRGSCSLKPSEPDSHSLMEISPYIVFSSKNLSSLKDVLEAFSSTVSCILNELSFVSSRAITRNLPNVICRLSISNKFSLLENVSAFCASFVDNQLPSPHPSPAVFAINLGKVLIKDKTVDLKVDGKSLDPLLILAENKSSLITLLEKILPQLPHKILVLDFLGIALQLRNTVKGLFLSEKDGFTSFSLMLPSNTSMHDYLTHFLEPLIETLNTSIAKDDLIQTFLRSSRYKDVNSLISEAAYFLSKSTCHMDKVREFLSDVENGLLSKFFEENRPVLKELLGASRIFLDLSDSTLTLSPTTIEFLTSLILGLCPKREYSLILIAPSSIASLLTESHVMGKASRCFSFSIFSTIGALPSQVFQKFNAIITEVEMVDGRKSKLFSLSRKGYPAVTFSISRQDFSLSLENDSIIDIEAKIIQLMEGYAYITEDMVSQSLGITKEAAREILNRLEKNIFYLRHVYLPTLNGKNVPVFFLETKTGKADEVILSYAHDLIEKICNETGLLLVELKDPKLGLDGFIENYPFKLALTDKEKKIERLIPQVKGIIEKHSSVIIVLIDERDSKLASELRRYFGDRVVIIYLNELSKLPLKLKAELLQKTQQKRLKDS